MIGKGEGKEEGMGEVELRNMQLLTSEYLNKGI